ncbi:hypothetical protein V6N13_021425 [Hibiscus sabdariffa]|uniref:Sieve element occlusion C-terminal domain-containing protein n=1 Tax=Hibiscus sabdariffa TaxID=183260 RepID=A0ABR2NPT5_9ROSI
MDHKLYFRNKKPSSNGRASLRELGFVSAIRGHLEGVVDDHNCTRFILPGINRGIAERVVYAECGRPMEMYLLC